MKRINQLLIFSFPNKIQKDNVSSISKTHHRLRKIMTVTSSSSFLVSSSAEAASQPRLEEMVENNMDEAHLFFKDNNETQHA